MSPIRTSIGAVAVASLLVLGAAAPQVYAAANEGAAAPRIFKWVDEHGIAHYTTDEKRIPRAVRKRLRSLPDVAAAAAPKPDLVGPPPDAPSHPEAWVSSNAPARPSEEEKESLENAELAARLDAVDAEIAGLEGEIADREEQILALLASAQGDTLREDSAFRALAVELPTLQADLEALRAQRVALANRR